MFKMSFFYSTTMSKSLWNSCKYGVAVGDIKCEMALYHSAHVNTYTILQSKIFLPCPSGHSTYHSSSPGPSQG